MLKVTKQRTAPLPLTLQQVKDWLRIEYDTDDTLLTNLIDETASLLEEYLNVSLVTTTITVLATARTELTLPYGPVISVTSVKDKDGNDVEYEFNGFTITYKSYTETTTFYEAGFAQVDAGLQLGWKEVIAWLYENRGDSAGFMDMLRQNANLNVYRQKIWI